MWFARVILRLLVPIGILITFAVMSVGAPISGIVWIFTGKNIINWFYYEWPNLVKGFYDEKLDL